MTCITIIYIFVGVQTLIYVNTQNMYYKLRNIFYLRATQGTTQPARAPLINFVFSSQIENAQFGRQKEENVERYTVHGTHAPGTQRNFSLRCLSFVFMSFNERHTIVPMLHAQCPLQVNIIAFLCIWEYNKMYAVDMNNAHGGRSSLSLYVCLARTTHSDNTISIHCEPEYSRSP